MVQTSTKNWAVFKRSTGLVLVVLFVFPAILVVASGTSSVPTAPPTFPQIEKQNAPINQNPLIEAPGIRRLTTEPWNSNSSVTRQYAISWGPDSSKIAYLSLESFSSCENETYQIEGHLQVSRVCSYTNYLVLGVMNADGTGKIKVEQLSMEGGGDRENGFFAGYDFDWSPDSKSIVYTDYEPLSQHSMKDDIDFASIWKMDLETGKKAELALGAAQPSWSPDGSKIAFISRAANEDNWGVWVMNADGSSRRKLVSHPGYDVLLSSWSPYDSKIVYMCVEENYWLTAPENVSTWVINADGTNDALLSSNSFFPQWSPDGRKLAYQSVENKGGEPELWQGSVWIINHDGTGKIQIRDELNALGSMFSKWSPDCTKIMAIVTENEVRILDTDGSGGYWTLPGYGSWSPDGKMIAFASKQGAIRVINSDGSNERELISTTTIEVDPLGLLWGPDGTKITFTASEAELDYGVRWWSDNSSIWVMTFAETESTVTSQQAHPETSISTPSEKPVEETEAPSAEEKKASGFDVFYGIVGLFAVAYLLRMRNGA